MLCLEAMHNVSTRVCGWVKWASVKGRFVDFLLFNVWERFAVVTAVGFHATEWNTFVRLYW
jgi:hypothetical protein